MALLGAIRQLSCHPVVYQAALAASTRCLAAASYSTSAPPQTFRAKDLIIQEKKTPKPVLPEDLAFGKLFTDHMLLAQHTTDGGWEAPRIVPFGPLQLHPAAQVLHYGTCCFEGMKAYLGPDGKGLLFRPEMNMARLLRSGQRLMLADFDPKELLECVKALLRLDRAWLPDRPGHSMYIRPYMFSHDGALGVHRSSATTLAVIMSPVGPYFKSGSAAVRLFLDTHNVRAWPGGPGAHKIGGNYAPTVMPQMAAMAQHKCSQVMYALPNGPDPLDATISECGAMNLFFVFDKSPAAAAAQPGGSSGGGRQLEVVTPPLDGTILPGVTRDSILQLLRKQPGVQVSERPLTVREVKSAHESGRLLELFGSGTACVVQPVGCVVTADGTEMTLPAGTAPAGAGAGAPAASTPSSSGSSGWGPEGTGSVAEWARRVLTDIQYGRVPGHPWSVSFE